MIWISSSSELQLSYNFFLTYIHFFSSSSYCTTTAAVRPGTIQGGPSTDFTTMRRPTAAVWALLQGMAILACAQKSEEVSRSRRSIIGVPTFVGDRFGQDQQRSVVGYDGQCRRMFEEAADDNDCYNAYYSASQRFTAQQPTEPEKLRNIYQFTLQ